MAEGHSHADVNYDSVPDRSNWGDEETITLKAIKKIVLGGKWLNLAAGDGRFNNQLLACSREVVAVDNDERALKKLVNLTPGTLKGRLKVEGFDSTKPFPYQDSFFDGCFCTATLYIFDPSSVKSIVSEIIRVVRNTGNIIVDFRTNIRRLLPDGNFYIYPGEFSYDMEDGRILLKECFKDQSYEIHEYEKQPAPRIIGTISYQYQSQCLLLIATVKK